MEVRDTVSDELDRAFFPPRVTRHNITSVGVLPLDTNNDGTK